MEEVAGREEGAEREQKEAEEVGGRKGGATALLTARGVGKGQARFPSRIDSLWTRRTGGLVRSLRQRGLASESLAAQTSNNMDRLPIERVGQ